MGRKLNKRLKKYMKRRCMPKRIAGVKIPKALRRAADTELGAALMAGVAIGAAGVALKSPAMRKLREDAQRFAVLVAHSLSETAQGAAASIKDAFDRYEEDERPARRTRAAATAH